MQIGIPAEIRGGETRVAATPETVKKFTAKGLHAVLVQSGAGAGASIPDEEYQAAGATIVGSAADLYGQSGIVLKVRGPETDELALIRKDAVLVGLLAPQDAEGIEALARHGLTAFAMEKLPRISRAQSMDVLSSQANIAGYKAVLMAANGCGDRGIRRTPGSKGTGGKPGCEVRRGPAERRRKGAGRDGRRICARNVG